LRLVQSPPHVQPRAFRNTTIKESAAIVPGRATSYFHQNLPIQDFLRTRERGILPQRFLTIHEYSILFSMFDDIKKIQELKRMQDSFKQEHETVQKRGISVTINGNMEVEHIILNPTLEPREAEEALRQCINEANKNIQKRLAKIMMASGGLGGF
jgi:DNA-binding protein YbaB